MNTRFAALSLLVIFVVLCSLPLRSAAVPGKLQKIREDTHSQKDDSSKRDDRDDDRDRHDTDDPNRSCPPDDPDCDDGGSIVPLVIFALWHVPHLMMEGTSDYPSDGEFRRAPYWKGSDGYMTRVPATPRFQEKTEDGAYLIGASSGPQEGPARSSRPAALRLSAEYGYGFDELHKPAGYLLVSSRWRVGFETGWVYLREHLPEEDAYDQLLIGDANVMFRFAQCAHAQMRSGLGARFMVDERELTAGFNFTYGMDVFPVNPLVISASVDLGNLGTAFFLHWRGTLGAVLFGVELFAGWDGMLIGSTSINGPIGGLRLWL